MPLLTVHCPAKINTFLSVGPRDESGYHPVRTVFQAVSLADTLQFFASNRFEITSDWSDLPPENTLTKTARFLGEISDLPPLRVHLTKQIPTESGLGGGSSDAAGLIRGLRKLVPNRWDDHFLRDTAKAVGMDVPFFLVGGRARAKGFGDQLSPMPDHERRWLVVIRPDVGVSTAAGYAALDALTFPFRDWPSDPQELYNDFERVAPCECGEAIERLRAHGAMGAGLSGSGSAVFGFFADETTAHEAHDQVQGERLGQSWLSHTETREESLWMS